MTSPAADRARRVSRRWPLVSAGVAVLLGIALGIVITLRGRLPDIDAEWMEEIVEHRSPLWEVPSRAMDFLGGGWFGVLALPLAVALVLALVRKPWSALYFVLASALSAGLVQALKRLFGRARPDEILLDLDSGAFPSGHVANAATLAVALGIMLWCAWAWAAGAAWVLLMLLSRTYLGAHWLSDTVGGVLVGAGVAILVWAPFASRLQKEWSGRRASSSVGG